MGCPPDELQAAVSRVRIRHHSQCKEVVMLGRVLYDILDKSLVREKILKNYFLRCLILGSFCYSKVGPSLWLFGDLDSGILLF